MSVTAQALNDVLVILNDGVEFYRDAKDAVDDAHLASLFEKIMTEKESFASDLTKEITLRGNDAEDEGTFVGSARQAYAKLRAAFGSTNKAFVSELEEHEDRILKKVRESLNDASTPELAKKVLSNHLETVQILHNEMALLKNQMAA